MFHLQCLKWEVMHLSYHVNFAMQSSKNVVALIRLGSEFEEAS